MFNLQGSEIIVILLLALVVLGPEKLPDAIRRFSRTYAELKKMGSGFQSELKSALDEPMREMRETSDLIRKAADPASFTDSTSDHSSAPTPDLDPDVDGDPDLDSDLDDEGALFSDPDPDVDGADEEFPDPGSSTVAVADPAAGDGSPGVVETTRVAAADDRTHNGTSPDHTPQVASVSVPTEGQARHDAVSSGSVPPAAVEADDESATA